ncbi:MAG: phosphatase PAP2 family protein [Paludibacteraceae bacterium]|nr:phosphatase PAP2 family protein [Paludibacteraceae bacterium]
MNLDSTILLWINSHYVEWLDEVMWTVSRATTWVWLYIVLVLLIIKKYRNWKTVLIILIGFGVAVGLSDYLCSGILKPLVCRLRPTHEPALEGMIHLVRGYTGGLYGFCSSHAANTMSVALLFSLLYKDNRATVSLMTWVALNCYSRMYLGVHYPGDILAGLLIGSAFALLAYWGLHRWVLPKEWAQCGSRRADDEAALQGGS